METKPVSNYIFTPCLLFFVSFIKDNISKSSLNQTFAWVSHTFWPLTSFLQASAPSSRFTEWKHRNSQIDWLTCGITLSVCCCSRWHRGVVRCLRWRCFMQSEEPIVLSACVNATTFTFQWFSALQLQRARSSSTGEPTAFHHRRTRNK